MEWHGVKIDLVGLAAAISAIAALYSAVKGNQKKARAEKEREKKENENGTRKSN